MQEPIDLEAEVAADSKIAFWSTDFSDFGDYVMEPKPEEREVQALAGLEALDLGKVKPLSILGSLASIDMADVDFSFWFSLT